MDPEATTTGTGEDMTGVETGAETGADDVSSYVSVGALPRLRRDPRLTDDDRDRSRCKYKLTPVALSGELVD